jgi:hypothetical protein
MYNNETLKWLLSFQESIDFIANLNLQKEYWLYLDSNKDIVSSFDETYQSFMDIFLHQTDIDCTYFVTYCELPTDFCSSVIEFIRLYSNYYTKVDKLYGQHSYSWIKLHQKILNDNEWLVVVEFAKNISTFIIDIQKSLSLTTWSK